jgi:hypothetical protein
MTISHRTIIAVLALGAVACSHSLSGKYADANGLMSVDFKGDSAYVSTMGATAAVGYKVDGNHVTLSNPDGNMVFTRDEDGSLSGGPTGKLVKSDR